MSNRRYQGKVVRWKGDRGFGFIQSKGIKKDIFLHISALPRSSRTPKIGDTVYFELRADGAGKYKAVHASFTSQRRTSKTPFQQRRSSEPVDITPLITNIITFGLLIAGAVFFGPKLWQNLSQPVATSSQNTSSEPVASTPPPTPSTPAPTTPVASKANCRIKGNISYDGNKRLYHKPGYPDYANVKISRPGERWFCTEQEAINAGWRDAQPN